MSVLPILPQGFVVGRILTSRGDSADADKLADTAVVVGMVDFTPATAYRKLDATTVVTHSKITAKLDSHGDLHPQREASDTTGSDAEDGIWLPTGTWKVTYRLNTGFGALPEHNIEVTEAHTEAAPLPLFANMGDAPQPGASYVTMQVPLNGQPGHYLVLNGEGSGLAWASGVLPEAISDAVEDYLIANPPAGGGLDTESVQDIVGAMVTGAGGTYNDAAGTITLPSSGGGGGFPVQQVSLTGSYVLDPVALGWPTTEIVTLAFTQDATGNRAVTYGSGVVMASGVSWLLAQGTAAGSEVVTTWRYSTGLAKWVCEGCWVSIAGGVPTDTTAPAVGTLAASAITNTGFTLTVSEASDAGGLHATPYAFTIDGGTTWSAYQASAVYVVSGLDASTAHTVNWRVRDAAGNVSTGTAQTVTTTATADTTPPVWSATLTPVGTPTSTVAVFQASAMATDDVGVSVYEVSYDNGMTWTTITPEIDWTFQLQGTGGTTYTQTQLRAKDAAGNTSTPVLSVPSYTMAAAQALLVADDFNRADGPLTTSSSGHPWTLEHGTQMPSVKDNALVRGFTGGVSPVASVQVGQADMMVSAVTRGPGYPAIYARLTDKDTDTYKLEMGNDGITPRAYRNGASLGAPVSCVLGDKVGISVKEEEGGTRVLILVNGVEAASYLDTTSPRPAGTKAGLWVHHAADTSGYDDFEVRAP